MQEYVFDQHILEGKIQIKIPRFSPDLWLRIIFPFTAEKLPLPI